MPRWLEILLTLVLFTIGMAIVSWVVHATVPSFDAWLVSHSGETGAFFIVAVVLFAAGLYGWHGHRRATKASGR